jgi:hypothetical protein
MSLDKVREAEQRILAEQAQHPDQPLDPEVLFEHLAGEFDDTTIAKAMWRLIDAAQLELTSDRKLARLVA